MVDLSIIILNYNAKNFVLDSIKSIEEHYPEEVRSGKYELIITDNESPDGSIEAFRAYRKKTICKTFHVIENGGNIGFSKGNNKGVPLAKGRYILFLNPDTVVYAETLRYMVTFMDAHPQAGAASCKLVNKDGAIDFNCHRGYPTPWNAFCYFSGLQRIFPKSHLFARYTQGWQDMNTTHEVEALEGAFMIIPRAVGEKVKWWDEDYFFYGEDLQLCYDIHNKGYKIYYVGEVSIMHIGGASSGIKKKSQGVTTANIETKRRVQGWRFDAMRMFYKKNYTTIYPKLVTSAVLVGINYLQKKNSPRL